jgi:hypothetical protein
VPNSLLLHVEPVLFINLNVYDRFVGKIGIFGRNRPKRRTLACMQEDLGGEHVPSVTPPSFADCDSQNPLQILELLDERQVVVDSSTVILALIPVVCTNKIVVNPENSEGSLCLRCYETFGYKRSSSILIWAATENKIASPPN